MSAPHTEPCGLDRARCRHPVHCPHCGSGWESGDLVKFVRNDGDQDELHCLECYGTFAVKIAVAYTVEKAMPPRPVEQDDEVQP